MKSFVYESGDAVIQGVFKHVLFGAAVPQSIGAWLGIQRVEGSRTTWTTAVWTG